MYNGVQTDRLVIEAEEGGVRGGVSLVSNLLGGQTVDKCRFVARIYRPSVGKAVMASAVFNKYGTDPIELLSGTSQQNAQQALQSLLNEVTMKGWRLIKSTGGPWYSYQFEKHYNVGDPHDLQVREAIWAEQQAAMRPSTKTMRRWAALTFWIAFIMIFVLAAVPQLHQNIRLYNLIEIPIGSESFYVPVFTAVGALVWWIVEVRRG